MSHVATVDIEIKDIEALDAACRRLGLELVQKCTTFSTWGGKRPCEHKIRVPGAQDNLEIGLVARTDGRPGWIPMLDIHIGEVLDKIGGEKCSLLRQAYATCAAIKLARMQGHSIQERRLPNGSVQLVMTTR